MNEPAPTVDLNSDLGESYGSWQVGDDLAMLGLVTSANVACGFHAGDPRTLRQTCEWAVEHGVAIGAQVGYHDLKGFGRRFIDMDPDDLAADVLYQIGALDAIARAAGGRVSYVKPHGALYNSLVHHEEQAGAVVAAVRDWAPGFPVLGLPASTWLAKAESAGLRVHREFFVDRAYNAEGALVPRSEAGAVLNDPDAVAARVVRMVREGRVEAIDGTVLSVHAESLCVHGDSPNAVAMARQVREALLDAGVTLSSFVDDGP